MISEFPLQYHGWGREANLEVTAPSAPLPHTASSDTVPGSPSTRVALEIHYRSIRATRGQEITQDTSKHVFPGSLCLWDDFRRR